MLYRLQGVVTKSDIFWRMHSF